MSRLTIAAGGKDNGENTHPNDYSRHGGGPTLVTDILPSVGEATDGTFDERTEVLGSQDPTATHCIIGTSEGFSDFLLAHFEATHGANTWDAVADHVCLPDEIVDVHVITHAFNDQGSTSPGSFSASIDWVPLAPTPDATSNTVSSEDDQLCVGTLWSMQDGYGTADGTDGNLQHESSDSPIVYGECLDLSTTSSDNHPGTSSKPGLNP